MSQNTTESQEQPCPTMSSSLTNLRMLLERMLLLQRSLTLQYEIFQELSGDYNHSCRSVELPGFTSFVLHSDQALKSSLEMLKQTLQQELLYVCQQATILKQSSTNTEQSNSSEKETC